MHTPPKLKLRSATIPNPYYSRAHPAGGSNPPTIPAVLNIRESAITTLASRSQLDAAQVAAADRFRALFEAMGGKGASAIDYGRVVVDAGRMRDSTPARNWHAAGNCLVHGFTASSQPSRVKAERFVRSPARKSALGWSRPICCAWAWTISRRCGGWRRSGSAPL